jgi:hypothetical protein
MVFNHCSIDTDDTFSELSHFEARLDHNCSSNLEPQL